MNDLLDKFIENAEVPLAIMSREDIVKAEPALEIKAKVVCDFQYKTGAFNALPQMSLLGEAMMIAEWRYHEGRRAFINEEYGIGYMIVDAPLDQDMADPFYILLPNDPPVRGCAYEVYKLRLEPLEDGRPMWKRDDEPDTYYLESTYNNGTVVEHAAVTAMRLRQGNIINIHGSSKLYHIALKSFRRALWRINGYPSHEMPKESEVELNGIS